MKYSQVRGGGDPAQRVKTRGLALSLLLSMLTLLSGACAPETPQALSPIASRTAAPTRTRAPERGLPTQTARPTLTPSLIPSATLTATTSPTPSPAPTLTPPPGISVLRKEMIEFYRGVDFRFTRSSYVQGELEIIGYSPNGFTTLTLRGGPENLNSAEIQIVTAGEPARLSTDYWQAFLGFTTPDPVKAAAWIKDNIPTAGLSGKVETLLGYVKLSLEVNKNTLKISVLPNH